MEMSTSYRGTRTRVRALIVDSPRNVSLHSFVVEPFGEDHVRVRIEACGLCTWEQRVYRGVKETYPFWGGHEVCGTVESANGHNAAGFKSGERVALALMRRCGKCLYCSRGLDNHCVYVKPEAVGPLPGGPRGLSDTMMVPYYQVFRLGAGVAATEGALVEPTACVLRSIERGQVAFGSTVVVIGSGTMGLIHTVLLKRLGCRVVLCGEDFEHVRAAAAGADVVLSLKSDNVEDVVQDITEGHGADAVFCTRGGVAGVELAVKLAGRGGRVVLYQSIRGEDIARLKMNDLHYREINLIGTISQTIADFSRAAELISSNPSLLQVLAAESFSADSGSAAFETAMDPNINRVFVSFK